MKTYVMTVRQTFMKGHRREGEDTNFVNLILNNGKFHTIRENYFYWKKVVDQVNAGEAVLSLRYWTGKPYRSKQKEFKQLTQMDFIRCESVTIQKGSNTALVCDKEVHINDLAQWDGLFRADFEDWFKDDLFQGIIIFFGPYEYMYTIFSTAGLAIRVKGADPIQITTKEY